MTEFRIKFKDSRPNTFSTQEVIEFLVDHKALSNDDPYRLTYSSANGIVRCIVPDKQGKKVKKEIVKMPNADFIID